MRIFENIMNFIIKDISMSHTYQPVMLITLFS
jgi:hypothetical protein